MRVSREKAAASHGRILDAASRLFRERGFDGVRVADLMQSAGLTHGGFYGHFESKETLMALACEHALAQSVARWENMRPGPGQPPLARLVRSYLSPRHRDDPGSGCVVAALAVDAARQAPSVRRAMTEGLRSLVDVLSRIVPGRTRAAKRRKALSTYASLIGALVLARAVDDAGLSAEILEAVAASVEADASGSPA